MKKALIWPLLVLVLVVGLWCDAWSAEPKPSERLPGEVYIDMGAVQDALRRAELDKQLRNNFVDCVLKCGGGVESKRPDALVRGCRDHCVDVYLWQMKRLLGEADK